MQIQQTVGGVKTSWERYQDAWKALQTLAKFRAASLQHPVPHQPDFQFERTTTSYPAWIKTIASLAPDFLSPSSNDLWNCPDIVDFTLLTKYIELEKRGSSEPFIPTTAKSTHSEATLVRFLGRLQHPPPTVISEWAKLIAASVEIMAFDLHAPRPPQPHEDDNLVTQGVQALSYYENMKKTLASFDTPTDNTSDTVATSVQPCQRSHATDVLKDFSSLIIDVCAGYVIFQTHALSDRPMTNAKLKKKSRQQAALAPTNNPSSSSAVTNLTSEAALQIRQESTKKLQTYQGKQNFQPLVYFLVVGGVQGLFLLSKNAQTAPVSECMSFMQAMAVIHEHSQVDQTPEAKIWSNLSAYLVELL
ncbi:hypothetical protein PCASD_16191 [Puccinia coronata f. sp. avenae]|uniref:Uncharacterized protein n=1 Tax=Puccinia coronata f. sp. avenae TaxID=200324 RepID=A0A2N5UBD6_9BASI|nr:hypothetical protein PCASD_16191 [Puccinia coronata f. sp. avenae]